MAMPDSFSYSGRMIRHYRALELPGGGGIGYRKLESSLPLANGENKAAGYDVANGIAKCLHFNAENAQGISKCLRTRR